MKSRASPLARWVAAAVRVVRTSCLLSLSLSPHLPAWSTPTRTCRLRTPATGLSTDQPPPLPASSPLQDLPRGTARVRGTSSRLCLVVLQETPHITLTPLPRVTSPLHVLLILYYPKPSCHPLTESRNTAPRRARASLMSPQPHRPRHRAHQMNRPPLTNRSGGAW